MLAWLYKKLGYHICEKFTRWEKHQADFRITPEVGGVSLTYMQYDALRCWQERKCEECGKTYKEEL